jgi:hypothetical protein
MTDRRTYRTELMNTRVLRLAGLAAPGRQWGLCIDGQLVASTDESMTGEQAQHWARRILGEHVTFELGDGHAGYWVADPGTPREH